MRNLNTKPLIFLLAGLSAVVLFLAALIQGSSLKSLLDVIKLVPTVATADGLAYFAFVTWLWRWKPLQRWLIPFPDLNGTWQGQIQTSWQTPEGRTPGPIPVILSIKQSFGRLSCVMSTAEMESHSYLEGFWIDKDAQIRRLCYSYTSRPKVSLRDRSSTHDGTVLFKIIGTPVEKLAGEYWTQRKTLGTISLTLRTRKHLDQLPDDLPGHPLRGNG